MENIEFRWLNSAARMGLVYVETNTLVTTKSAVIQPGTLLTPLKRKGMRASSDNRRYLVCLYETEELSLRVSIRIPQLTLHYLSDTPKLARKRARAKRMQRRRKLLNQNYDTLRMKARNKTKTPTGRAVPRSSTTPLQSGVFDRSSNARKLHAKFEQYCDQGTRLMLDIFGATGDMPGTICVLGTVQALGTGPSEPYIVALEGDGWELEVPPGRIAECRVVDSDTSLEDLRGYLPPGFRILVSQAEWRKALADAS